jgi:hypothetical protein
MLTRVCYLYRDASNYKFWGHFVLDGAITRDDLVPYLADGEWFVPEMVGLPALRPCDWTEDDHFFHELHEFEPASEGEPLCTAKGFVLRMKRMQARGYFPV